MEFTKIEDLNQDRMYKVCQITIGGTPSMYFVEDRYGWRHKDILNEILKLNCLPHMIVEAFSDEGLVYRGVGFTVNGMGGAVLLSKKYIMLFGNSVGFDMSISRAHTEKYRKDNPEWKFNIPTLPEEDFIS